MEKPSDTVTRSRRKNLWEAAPKKGEKLRSSNLLQTAQWPPGKLLLGFDEFPVWGVHLGLFSEAFKLLQFQE